MEGERADQIQVPDLSAAFGGQLNLRPPPLEDTHFKRKKDQPNLSRIPSVGILGSPLVCSSRLLLGAVRMFWRSVFIPYSRHGQMLAYHLEGGQAMEAQTAANPARRKKKALKLDRAALVTGTVVQRHFNTSDAAVTRNIWALLLFTFPAHLPVSWPF